MNGRRSAVVGLVLLIVCVAFAVCRHVVSAPLCFEDVTAPAGVKFRHFNDTRCAIVPEDVGSGLAWGDYDGDGYDDLFIANFSGCLLRDRAEIARRPGCKLFRNNRDGTFTDVTEAAGLAIAGWFNAALWFDYDNDGRLDLAITHFEGVRLFHNNGNGTFTDVTTPAGLAGLKRYFLGMSAGDYDKDGNLDLYLCGYLRFDRNAARPVNEGGKRPLVEGRPAVWTNPVSYPAESNVLLRNNGNGTFTDVTAQAGVADREGKSMQAVFADFDNDGWIDLFVGNDVSTPDVLFRNQRNGTFAEVSMPAGTHDFRATMGLAVGDLWHRGWLDVATTHWVNEDHAVWKNVTDAVGNLSFDDLAPGLFPQKSLASVGWGCGFHDFDNDGWLDFLVGNGSTMDEERSLRRTAHPTLVPQRAEVYWRDAAHDRFVRLSEQAGPLFQRQQSTRGVAFADYDHDGRVDVAALHHNDAARLYRNVSRAGNWLEVVARGGNQNRFAVNARVRVQVGKTTQMREIVAGSSYLSQDSLTAHFGLGTAASADRVAVKFYPSGVVRRIERVKCNQIVKIRE